MNEIISKNKNLQQAKEVKNDEFYTQLKDIENELINYKEQLKDKVIYCNCDNPEESNFWKYFRDNFNYLELKKLIATHFNKDGSPSYKLEWSGEMIKKDTVNMIKTPLKGDGDFRSIECIEILKSADLVITNPPFSLFREFVAQLTKYEKKYIIIGNLNAITYKEIFPLIKNNKLWMGATYFNGGAAYFIGDKSLYDEEKMSNPKNAYIKDDKLYWRINGVRWFTNVEHKKRNQIIVLQNEYKQTEYPKYDNYNAIEVSKVSKIPNNYKGELGVPISFLDKYCPNQFEIVRFRKGNDDKDLAINGECPYFRIIIKKKENIST